MFPDFNESPTLNNNKHTINRNTNTQQHEEYSHCDIS